MLFNKLLRKLIQANSNKQLSLTRMIQQQISDIQTHNLQGSTYVISLFSDIPMMTSRSEWNLEYQNRIIDVETEVVRGFSSVIEVISFEHR